MKRFLIIIAAVSFLFMGAIPVCAHDTQHLYLDFSDTGVNALQQVTHDDADPWAGWVIVTATNNGSEAWGDFHFQIYDPAGTQDISNVDWMIDSAYTPVSTQTLSGINVDNTSIGARLDLYFYGDGVNPGESATFQVYNVNPDQLSFFGVQLYPTPVPLPGAAWLLLSGIAGVFTLKRKIGR